VLDDGPAELPDRRGRALDLVGRPVGERVEEPTHLLLVERDRPTERRGVLDHEVASARQLGGDGGGVLGVGARPRGRGAVPDDRGDTVAERRADRRVPEDVPPDGEPPAAGEEPADAGQHDVEVQPVDRRGSDDEVERRTGKVELLGPRLDDLRRGGALTWPTAPA
jgi:hypothetical protein